MPEALQDVTFALPGTWWRIPIQDPDAATRSIRSYVDAVAGPRDDLAQTRAAFREELSRTVADAREVAGQTMYMAIELSPGVPTSISLTTYRPELPPTLSSQVDFDLSVEAFAANLSERSPDDDVSVWSEDGVGLIRLVGSTFVTDESGEQAENLKVDYWLLAEDQPYPTLAVFSSPVIWDDMDVALLDLFDAIVATVELPQATGELGEKAGEIPDGESAPSTGTSTT